MTNNQISTLVTIGLTVAFCAIFALLIWHARNIRRKQERNRK